MPVDRENLPAVLTDAWRVARQHTRDDNRKRSSAWVDALALRFQQAYPVRNDDHVFWRSNSCNGKVFGLNEFLFDILVCRIDHTEPRQRSAKPLPYISHCHWQIESEFAHNSRAILVDMSKLVAGGADHKLLVASRRTLRTEQALLERCANVARCCRAKTYIAFVPHPREWDSNTSGPHLHEWTTEGWRRLGQQSR